MRRNRCRHKPERLVGFAGIRRNPHSVPFYGYDKYMKTLIYLVSCLCVISCTTTDTSPRKTNQERIKDQLRTITTTSGNTDQSNDKNQTVRLLIHPEKLSSGLFRATLTIDQNKNQSNFSMNEITATVIAFANSSGYSKVDCSLNQIACFVRGGIHLSVESTDSPEIIRLEIAKDKTILESAADTAVKIFFEGLLLHLQQPSRR